MVHGRHRDIDNVQYETGLKYESSKLSSAEQSVDDGKFERYAYILFCWNETECNWKWKKKEKKNIENSIKSIYNSATHVQ